MDALSSVESRHENFIDGFEFSLRCVDSLSGSHKCVSVLLVCDLVQIVELAQTAFRLIRTSVADIRRTRQTRTRLLLESRTGILPAAQTAVGAVSGAVRPSAHSAGLATVAVYAGVEPSPVEGLGRFHAVVHDLALAGGTRDAELAHDLRERHASSKRCLELKAQIVGEVFVFSFLMAIGPPLLFDMAELPCRFKGCHIGKRKWALMFVRLNGQVFPSPLSTYFRNRT